MKTNKNRRTIKNKKIRNTIELEVWCEQALRYNELHSSLAEDSVDRSLVQRLRIMKKA